MNRVRSLCPFQIVALLLLYLGTCAFAAQASEPPTKKRPNIVLVLVDDIGINGFSCYGSDKYKTPKIDELARGGIRFETCYACALCGPSRVMIMTGRYAFRTGATGNGNAGQPTPKTEVGLAATLKQAGYATGMVGKWKQMSGLPGSWGFDEHLSTGSASGIYWNKTLNRNGTSFQPAKDAYIPDLMHEFAVDFMTRNKSRPFFLHYAMHLVHSPTERTPDTVGDGKQNLFNDNVAYMDKLVGKLVADLERLGIRDNTLILFTADNGSTGAWAGTTIGGIGIQGKKGNLLEGGVRVPLIANWKGTTPAGKVSSDLVDFSDFYTTFAEVADAKLPENVKLDGRSFAPQLRGQPGRPREWIFAQAGNNWAVRDGRWKLYKDGSLFDLTSAPLRETPVAVSVPDARTAQARLQAVLDTLKPGAGGK